jgi:hypothetical protein
VGIYTKPPKVKLVVAFLAMNKEYLESARKEMQKLYGEEEEVQAPFAYSWTHYYESEVGDNPIRCLVSYKGLVEREELVSIKKQTNCLEQTLGENRPVNIDPGYMTLGQFFLATTKDQRHRVYVGQGIFMEVTLYFQDKTFHSFPWTYPEYASNEYKDYFLRVRHHLACQMKGEKKLGSNNVS